MVHGLVSRISRSLPGIYSNIVVGAERSHHQAMAGGPPAAGGGGGIQQIFERNQEAEHGGARGSC